MTVLFLRSEIRELNREFFYSIALVLAPLQRRWATLTQGVQSIIV